MNSKKAVQRVIGRTAIRKSFDKILERTALCSIATVNKDGSPHLNTAFFARKNDSLYFLSDISSRHSKNIKRNPKVAAGVFDSRQEWNSDKIGLQLFGRCTVCVGREDDLARKVYAKKFEDYAAYIKKEGINTDPSFRFFVFRIERFIVLDEKAFGEENFLKFKI